LDADLAPWVVRPHFLEDLDEDVGFVAAAAQPVGEDLEDGQEFFFRGPAAPGCFGEDFLEQIWSRRAKTARTRSSFDGKYR
jgi:hypothetical protein